MTVSARGYADELASLEAELAMPLSWDDAAAVTRRAFRLEHRALLTGAPDHIAAAEAFVRAAVERLGPAEDLVLLLAHLALFSHRVDEAVAIVAGSPLAQRADGMAVLGDACMQRADVAGARAWFARAVGLDRRWDLLMRLAEADEDDGLFEEAAESLTAKQMRAYAYIEAKRAALCRKRGDAAGAEAHLAAAEAAYPGWPRLPA